MDVETNLASLFASYYKKMYVKGINYIPDTQVAKIIMIRLYDRFVSDGSLLPVEELPITEKKVLTSECRLMKDVFFTNDKLKMYCKILHTINALNED